MVDESGLRVEDMGDGTVRITLVSPNQPKTPQRSVRVETELWEAAKAKAAREGRDLSEVVRELLWRYVTDET